MELSEKENKCEKIGFAHAWEDITSNLVYLTNPLQYPDRQERCKNCGLIRTFREKKESRIEYSDGKERSFEGSDGCITIPTNELISGFGTTTSPKTNS